MLRLTIPETEVGYRQETCEFIYMPKVVLELEHSLSAISKWEQKYHKTFLSQEPHPKAEMLDYIRCMTLNDVSPDVYMRLSDPFIKEINAYMDDSMTAIYWPENPMKNTANSDAMTSEVIYYWMVTLQIPFECQYWHINRLLNLIKVCNVKNKSAQDVDTKALASRNAAINAARRKAHNSRG